MPLGSAHYRTSERMEAQARAFSVSPQARLQVRPCSAPPQGSSVASQLEEGQWAALDMGVDVGEDGGVITEPWGMNRPFFTPRSFNLPCRFHLQRTPGAEQLIPTAGNSRLVAVKPMQWLVTISGGEGSAWER